MPAYPGFIGPSYTSQSVIADCERTINWYTEVIESGHGKNRMALYPTPGRSLLAAPAVPPGSTGRAMFLNNGRLFSLIGNKFCEILPASVTILATVGTASTGPAYIRSNGTVSNQLAICSERQVWIYDLTTNTLSAPIAGLVADMIDYLDGFFIALDRATSTIRISNYGAGLTWDPLQFRVRAKAPDGWQAIHVVHGEIWLIGSQSYEVWNNIGTAPFPFAPIPGVLFQEGTRFPDTVTHIGEHIVWLTANEEGQGQVVVSDQYAPRRVSNHALEYTLQQLGRNGGSLLSSKGLTYQEDGHQFYILRVPELETAWCFDLSTMTWHERAEWDGIRFSPWFATEISQAFGRLVALDYQSPNVYNIGIGVTDGSVVRRVRRAPHLYNDKRMISYSQLELDMEVGTGSVPFPIPAIQDLETGNYIAPYSGEINVKCIGGGGAGASNFSVGGGGGGGGGYAEGDISVVAGQIIAVSKGAGGAAVVGAGQSGGNSSFGASVVATGGGGGGNPAGGSPGAAGVGTVGTILRSGGAGGIGAAGPISGAGGGGAAGQTGAGTAGANSPTSTGGAGNGPGGDGGDGGFLLAFPAVPGSIYGGGGGGCFSNVTAPGASGADGLVRVLYNRIDDVHEARVMMRFSDDGGKTFGNEIMATAGELGQYFTRVWWHRLGACRDRVFEISVSDAIPWRIVNAFIDFTPWRH